MKNFYLILLLAVIAASPARSQDTLDVTGRDTTILNRDTTYLRADPERDTIGVRDTTYLRAEPDSVRRSEAPRDRDTTYAVVTREPQETLFGTPAAIKNTFGIGPRAGWYRSYNASDGAFYFGIQTRLRLTPYLGFEGSADYRDREEFLFARTASDSAQRGAKVRSVPLSVSALVFLPVAFNFVPYAVGGVAWYHTIVDYTNDPNRINAVTSSRFGYHFGGGLELPFSEHVSLGADYRWIFLRSDLDIENPPNNDGYVITGSLMFYF
jgi:opacity protein-like surface antigen